MSRKKLKKPKADTQRGKISIPQTKEPSDHRQPAFSFKHLNGIECEHTDLPALIDRFKMISHFTWKEWKIAPRTGYGLEPMPRNALKKGIPPGVTDDVNFLVFRFAKGRVIGFRDDIIFQIIHIDCKFKAYKH